MNRNLVWIVALVASSVGGCLDPEPVVIERKDRVTASPACLQCLASPHGCGEELAACRAAPTCSRGYDCTFQRACVGGTVKTFVSCLPGCTIAAGFTSPDDPGRLAGLRIYECITRGACSALCFTDGADGGLPPSDASPDASTPDAADAAPGACANPSDEAIASNTALTKQAAGDCGLGCFGSADMDCNINCVVMKTGFSRPCATCWADSIDCAAQNCIVPCLKGSDDPECVACTDQFCTPAFKACSGLP
jgi:hypothetical protein